MANEDKRIIEQPGTLTLYNDDWLLTDRATEGEDGGTRKIQASQLKKLFNGDIVADEWVALTTYNRGAFVTHEGKLYYNNSGGALVQTTFNSSAWLEVKVDSILKNMISSIALLWESNGIYYKNDLVMYGGSLYYCCVSTSTQGTWKSTEWMKTTTGFAAARVQDTVSYLWFYPSETDPPVVHPYYKGDLILYKPTGYDEDTLFMCLVDLPNGDTEWVPEHWLAVYNVGGALKKIYEDKADKDGIYDSLVAGNIISDSYEVDNGPYNYRASHIGSALDLRVVGGTVAWNQLVQNGNFADTSIWLKSNSTLSVSNNEAIVTTSANGTAYIYQVNTNLKDSHKYLYSSTLKGSESPTAFYQIGNLSRTKSISTTYTQINDILSPTSTSGAYATIFVGISNAQAGQVLNIKNCMVIDLTQAFGSTIADYIYSLEQSTAGSGIAWLKSYGFLTKDYYAYDSGSLQSVNVASRKIVGKNLLNSNGETPSITGLTITKNSNGSITIIGSVASATWIPLTTNGTFFKLGYNYTLSGCPSGGSSTTYQIDIRTTNTLGTIYKSAVDRGSGFSFEGTNETAYVGILIRPNVNINETFNSQIELGSTATSYEPYKKISYPLDSSLTFRGILKKDANNNLYYDGDVYNADGSVKRKWGYIDLSTLTWNSGTIGQASVWYATLSGAKLPSNSTPFNGFGFPYEIIRYNGISTSNSIAIRNNGVIYVNNGSTTTEPTGQYIYELATPTTESAQPYTNPQLVFSNGTEEFVDGGTSASTPTRDVDIPCGQDSKYYLDIKGKVEQLYGIPDVPSTNGTYTLKATRSASGVTYSWVSD